MNYCRQLPSPAQAIVQHGSSLPGGEQSFFKFTLQSRDRLYNNFEPVVFCDVGDPVR
jgi:hypothetical protein